MGRRGILRSSPERGRPTRPSRDHRGAWRHAHRLGPERHGKPVAFYSDKHSIFRVHHDGSTGRAQGVTQFGRALAELNIGFTWATSPQAKGPVERMNTPSRDRLQEQL